MRPLNKSFPVSVGPRRVNCCPPPRWPVGWAESQGIQQAREVMGFTNVNLPPADIILVRMTSDSTRPPEQRYNYKNAFDGLVKLVKEEGTKGLTRGLSPNTVRAAHFFVGQQ